MIIDEQKLDKLAELAIKTGVALQRGQDLLLTAPIEALPLVRRIAVHAYKEGANIVTPLFSDPEITLSRFNHASDESFDKAPSWLFNGMGEAFDNNTARLAVVGEDPLLLSSQDPDKVSRANKATSVAYKPARERITRFDINWNINIGNENDLENLIYEKTKVIYLESPGTYTFEIIDMKRV